MTVQKDKRRIQITLWETTLEKIAKDAARRKTPPASRVSEIVEDHYDEGDSGDEVVKNV